MDDGAANLQFTRRLVGALADLGLRHACISPGSRSTPLALAFAAHPDVTDWSHHDERSGSFYALGIALATRTPVAVVSTSGTAAAEFHPAVIEARLARVPLLVLTADRPPDLRDVGAPQAVDQVKLYGDAVKWFHEVGVPDRTLIETSGALAAAAWANLVDVPPGPVHLNLPFREPLVPVGDLPPEEGPGHHLPGYLPGVLQPTDRQVETVAALLGGSRTLVVCGPQADPGLATAVASLAAAVHLPVVADPLSGVRAGSHDLARVIARGDLLAGAGALDRLRPDAVLRLGAVPTSKPLWRWLQDHREVPQVLVDDAGWRDPMASASTVVRTHPVAMVAALAKSMAPAPAGWDETWIAADGVAARAADAVVEDAGFPTEPGVVAALGRTLPAGATVTVASSMPVRDLDAFFPAVPREVRFLANRGANGIDGFLSTGFGAALGAGTPAYLLAGDLSFLHDLTGLAAAARLGVSAALVVVNNDGGGIFHFLPQAGMEHFERHFGTPHGLDPVRVAEALGVPGDRATTAADLDGALAAPQDGPRLIEVRTDRAENVTLHRAIREAVAAALE
jgi:2-succinyl-5-enolpyruvyl-6-hydroxy-3-cyclohexene-1-carboxylate synthase